MAKIKVNIGTVEAPIWLEMDAKNADTLNGVSMTQIQQKIDEAVQKANEAFTSASNGKNLIRDTILAKEGQLVDADGDGVYTFQELADGINTLQGEDISEGLNAVAGDIRLNKTAAVEGTVVTGTLPVRTTTSVTANGSLSAGIYDQNVAINVPDPSLGTTATAGDLRESKTMRSNGSGITGSIPTRTTTSVTSNTILPAGIYDNSININVPDLSQGLTATANDILLNKTARVGGQNLTGTIPTRSTTTVTSNSTLSSGYYPSSINVDVPPLNFLAAVQISSPSFNQQITGSGGQANLSFDTGSNLYRPMVIIIKLSSAASSTTGAIYCETIVYDTASASYKQYTHLASVGYPTETVTFNNISLNDTLFTAVIRNGAVGSRYFRDVIVYLGNK